MRWHRLGAGRGRHWTAVVGLREHAAGRGTPAAGCDSLGRDRADCGAGGLHVELKPAVGAELARVLNEQLSSAGYTTSVMADVAAAGSDPDEFDYTKLKTDADAILHVWVIDAGVYSHASSLSYKPRLNVGMRLVSARDSEELLYQYIYYGADARTLSDETIPADPKYAYLTFDAVMERADEAAGSLRDGARAIGELVVDLVRRNGSAQP